MMRGGRGLPAAVFVLLGLMGTAAAEPDCAPRPDAAEGLARFHSALDELADGKRKTVTILHLGDSHIALDHLTGVMRRHWTAAFGNAGRGLPPGVAYRYYAPQGYAVAISGAWELASSLRRDATGPFGLQGYRISSAAAGSRMTIDADDTIAAVEIDAVGGPASGALTLQIDGAAPLRLVTRAEKEGLVRLRVPAADARRLVLKPAGDGVVTLLGWTLISGKPGIRYDSHGVTGATIDVIDRWDEAIVDRQIEQIAPDLVIFGFGTNEGFNDALDLDAYSARFERIVRRVRTIAPRASIAVLGAFDSGRRAKPGMSGECGDGWAVPRKLDALRAAQRMVARETDAFFFDASSVMGGPCGIDRWAKATPSLAWPDRVHLTPEGARRAGDAIWRALMGGWGRICPHP